MIEKSIKIVGIMILLMIYSCGSMTKCHGGDYCECRYLEKGPHYEEVDCENCDEID